MPFEEFRQRGGRARFGFPVITVMRSGSVGLNKMAYERLGSPTHVILAYDREKHRIGVRACDASEDAAHPVRSVATGASWIITARSFLRYYDVDTSATARYKGEWNEPYLVADLEAPIHTEKRRLHSSTPLI